MAYRINYEQVMRQADKIEEEAQEVHKVILDLDGILSSTGAVWKGKAADTFHQECLELKSEMMKSRQQIQTTASKIRKIARRLKEVDDRAAAEAKKLKT